MKDLIRKHRTAFPAAIALPCIPFFYLYARNAASIAFSDALALLLAMIVLTAVLYAIAALAFHEALVGLIFCTLCWLSFMMLGRSYLRLQAKGFSTALLVVCVLLLYAGLLLLVGHLLRHRTLRSFRRGVTITIALLFAFNLFPAARSAFHDARPASGWKSEFAIDPDLPTPNVYWFHTDGMLGFDAMERYFGDDQAALKGILCEKGFSINESAMFEATHRTAVAMPTLMCPQYFDERLDAPLSKLFKDTKAFRIGGTELAQARKHNELVAAFQARGYHTSTIANSDTVFLPITERFYDCFNAEQPRTTPANAQIDLSERTLSCARKRDCVTLFRRILPIAMLSEPLNARIGRTIDSACVRSNVDSDVDPYAILGPGDRKQFYETLPRALDEILRTQETPRLALISFNIAHGPFVWDEEGRSYPHDSTNPLAYPPQHRYAATVLLRLIDMVLERDPEAVIVLQADHGLHLVPVQRFGKELGLDDRADVKRLYNGTFSAVRFPASVGGNPKSPLPPLDIARTLINDFVGPNYSLRGTLPLPY